MIRQNSLQLQLLFLAFSFFSSASSFGQTSPSWIHCANENQQCSFSGMAQVRYGASGKYFTGSYKSNVSCSNSVFGDPLVGLLKSCDYQIIPSIQFCANENQSCSFSGIKTLRYGANGVYYSKQFSGGVKCSNAVFGDPISGVFKHCDIVNDLIASTAPTPIAVRNPLQQPFASTSIWNMPIGSAAVYVPANMPTIPNNDSWAPMPMVDEEHIVLKAAAPLTNINFSSAGWSAASRCNQTGGLLAQVPIPTNYVVANDNANSSSAFLLADGRSIIQTQPFARCSAGGSATSLVKFASVDLYGDGMARTKGSTPRSQNDCLRSTVALSLHDVESMLPLAGNQRRQLRHWLLRIPTIADQCGNENGRTPRDSCFK
jgi:hypothetical protein